MRNIARCFLRSKPKYLGSVHVETTLYELIETVNEEIKPGEEHWLPLIVDHMLIRKATKLDKKENMYMEA